MEPVEDVKKVMHPVVVAAEAVTQGSWQLKVADTITNFAGSMRFVWIHVFLFAVWCGTGLFGLDKFPFNFLTMTVSLEAIFLSTFVMIGQNRQSKFAQDKASHDYEHQEAELQQNTKLTGLVHALTKEIHTKVMAAVDEVHEVAAEVVPTPPVRRRRSRKPSA